MESTEFSELVAKLKGSAISCLMLMVSAQEPIGIETLRIYSGYCQQDGGPGDAKAAPLWAD